MPLFAAQKQSKLDLSRSQLHGTVLNGFPEVTCLAQSSSPFDLKLTPSSDGEKTKMSFYPPNSLPQVENYHWRPDIQKLYH